MTSTTAAISQSSSLQLDNQGCLRHFLTIDGLSKEVLTALLATADSFVEQNAHAQKQLSTLTGKMVVNLFFEASTRTRSTFELAAKRLSADILNLNISSSSTTKGESLLDTIANLEAMHTDIFIVRHPESGAAHLLAQHVKPHVAVINAGDGRHAHPTQALLDIMTIRRYKKNFSNLCVTLVGDITHSRVARSAIYALTTLGVNEIRVVAPKTLLPAHIEDLGVHVFHTLDHGIRDADVIMMLRLQNERMQSAYIPSTREFYNLYGLTSEKLKLAKPDVLLLHPGPTNRGVEIESSLMNCSASAILEQVSNGIAARMAVMSHLVQSRQPIGEKP